MPQRQYRPGSIGIIGYPVSKGQQRGGTELGPSVLREASLVSKLESYGNRVTEYGDVEPDPEDNDEAVRGVNNPKAVGSANRKEQPDLVVVWVDAHADINTPLTSSSGNIHGMPLSFLVRELRGYIPELPGFEWCSPCISIRDIIYIGLRDVDPAERKIIEEFGMHSYSMHKMDKHNIWKVVQKALKKVDPSGSRPIHVSFDVDAMDPTVAPCTGTPVPGGLTLRESLFLAEEIAKTGRLKVLDIAEVNPLLVKEEDDKQKTLNNTIDVITSFYGRRREGNAPPNYQIPRPDPLV